MKRSEFNFLGDDMALRQDSEKEPSVELFIKVSHFSFSFVKYLKGCEGK